MPENQPVDIHSPLMHQARGLSNDEDDNHHRETEGADQDNLLCPVDADVPDDGDRDGKNWIWLSKVSGEERCCWEPTQQVTHDVQSNVNGCMEHYRLFVGPNGTQH